jgi:hypothetical protein
MKHSKSLLVLVTALVAGTMMVAACGKAGKIPGANKLPGGGIPDPNAKLDPSGCGGFGAGGDAGRKLKAFLEATAAVDKAAQETADVVKNSCTIIGTELGMTEADYKGSSVKDVCGAVWARVDKNLNGVAVKSKAALKLKLKPAVCSVDAKAELQAAATCEGKATADFKATCNGTCKGTCKGNNNGGKCDGTCEGECDGYADVNASGECKASAEVNAAVSVKCTEPEVTVEWDAKLIVDKKLAEATLKGLKAGLPKIFLVRERIKPLKHAVEGWVKSAAGLKDSAIKLGQSFKDQAACVSSQILAAAKMSANIQANVSVSVEISAGASGSVGQ